MARPRWCSGIGITAIRVNSGRSARPQHREQVRRGLGEVAQAAEPQYRGEARRRIRAKGEECLAGAGSIYRHDYEDLAAQHVWDAVRFDLPPLRVAREGEFPRRQIPPITGGCSSRPRCSAPGG